MDNEGIPYTSPLARDNRGSLELNGCLVHSRIRSDSAAADLKASAQHARPVRAAILVSPLTCPAARNPLRSYPSPLQGVAAIHPSMHACTQFRRITFVLHAGRDAINRPPPPRRRHTHDLQFQQQCHIARAACAPERALSTAHGRFLSLYRRVLNGCWCQGRRRR